MDILFGDPFYHNIINHLSIKDLCNLQCVCSHYKNTITQTYINIRRIKNNLYKVFGNSYREQIPKMKQLKPNHDTSKCYNKYFVVCVRITEVGIMSDKFIVRPYQNKWLHIKDNVYDASVNGYFIKTQIFGIPILYFEGLKDYSTDIQNIKNNCYGEHKKSYNLYWLENDKETPFNLLEHL